MNEKQLAGYLDARAGIKILPEICNIWLNSFFFAADWKNSEFCLSCSLLSVTVSYKCIPIFISNQEGHVARRISVLNFVLKVEFYPL